MRLMHAITGILASLGWAMAQAQTYPERPIRIVVPSPPGGVNDIVARVIGIKLQEKWGQPVVIDNKPGANSIIGTEIVAKSAPDGYTLLINTTGGMSINPLIYPKLPYDGQKGFAPISLLVTSPMMLGVGSSVPANTMKEFIAYAKANPGKLNNSAGSTTSRVAAELFKQMADISVTSVPYKGSAPAVQGVAAGETQMIIVDSPSLLPLVRAGKIKGLAVAWPKRLASFPDVPTFQEAGLPAYEMGGWVGIFAPAGTPPAVVSRINAEVARIVRLPEVSEKLGAANEVVGSSAEELATIMRNDIARYAPIVKAANITAD
jgi:tripartite-type tricarboxylate transporter receptor subunit TctC